MDETFRPAQAAILAGDLERLTSLLREDPSLATSRSSESHPTLLQCLALEAGHLINQVEMASLLVEAGADVNEGLLAAASGDNSAVAAALLDAGAEVDGNGPWSPLEETLYWGNAKTQALLLQKGARISNLRTAAGLGRMDRLTSFFRSDETLGENAGRIAWPFGDLESSNHSSHIGDELSAKVRAWTHSPQEILDNAFVYACMGDHGEAADYLLQRGARINAIPAGFDYAASGLHYAALRGHSRMVEFLLDRGADPNLIVSKVGTTASDWARHGGHFDLAQRLLVEP